MTTNTPQNKTRRFQQLAAISALALGGLLSACGSASAPASAPATEHRVSAVQVSYPKTKPAATPTTNDTERPIIRNDTSGADIEHMYKTWGGCLESHGFTGDVRKFDPSTLPDGAAAACASLEPETEFARSKRLDANFQDELDAWVTCANAHGIKSFARGGNLWLVDGLPPTSKQDEMNACQDTAFGY